jgi:hypothetical protein
VSAVSATTVVAGILNLMSTTKIVSGVAGVIVLLAVGSAVYHRNLSHESEAALSSASRERDDLRARLSAAEQRARETDETLAATQKTVGDLRAQTAVPAAAPASRASTSNVGPVMEYILDHPELQGTHVQQQVLRAKVRYDRFIKSAGLSAGEEARFLKAVEEGIAGELDFMGALHAKGYGVGNLPQDPQDRMQLQQLHRDYSEKNQARMREALGDARLQQFAQYSGMIGERNVTDQVASQLYYTDTPLTAQQAEQLAQVLKEDRFKPGEPSPHNTMGGNFVLTPRSISGRMGQAMQQGGMTALDWQNPITDAALVRAQTILTPTQFAALQRVQAQQVTQFQLAPPPPGPAGSAAPNSAGGK